MSSSKTYEKQLRSYFNPTTPVKEKEYLKGRDKELKRSLDALSNGECIIIQGARRIGKTSLIQILATLCSHHNHHCISLSFQAASSYDHFAFTQCLVQGLYDAYGLGDAILPKGRVLRDHLKTFKQKAKLGLEEDKYLIIILDEFQPGRNTKRKSSQRKSQKNNY